MDNSAPTLNYLHTVARSIQPDADLGIAHRIQTDLAASNTSTPNPALVG
jgi:hypothetical protein